jgi:hypothetical protein
MKEIYLLEGYITHEGYTKIGVYETSEKAIEVMKEFSKSYVGQDFDNFTITQMILNESVNVIIDEMDEENERPKITYDREML